mmetsp:Transcript_20130/g.37361  ORF Transcript_20130/g.37361 Transcript_20130/m.37361 type:complete len:452 (-) Transcript_20130:1220-2575(-)
MVPLRCRHLVAMVLPRRNKVTLQLQLWRRVSYPFSRHFSGKRKKSKLADMPEELLAMVQGNSSRTKERADSVTESILRERLLHHNKMEEIDTNMLTKTFVSSLSSAGLGSKKRLPQAYQLAQHKQIWRERAAPITVTGAGGRSLHLASCHKDWPIFEHLLPEIAFVGHSNSGKSTLVNAMIGVLPRNGPAQVSERAGWTDQLCFYQLGKKPPLLTLVDCPGYGHAVATADMKKEWRKMTDLYLNQRIVLSRCYVLVDCMRGLCSDDSALLRRLNKAQIPWKIILTKCDLLDAADVARSLTVVYGEVLQLTEEVSGGAECAGVSSGESDVEESSDSSSSDDNDDEVLMPIIQHLSDITDRILPVSSSTGANIPLLWNDLCACAEETSVNPSRENMKHVLREHVLAQQQRREALLKKEKKANNTRKRGRGKRTRKSSSNGGRKSADGDIINKT